MPRPPRATEGEREIEDGKKEQRETFQLQDVNPMGVGKEVEDGGDDGFVQEEAVIGSRRVIDQQGGDEVELRPGEGAPDRTEGRTKAARDEEVDNAGDDSAVADEKADRADIGEIDLKIGREEGLEGAADSPEVGNLGPAVPSREQGDDDRHHCPIAKLKRQGEFPKKELVLPEVSGVADVVRGQHESETDRDRAIEALRVRAPDGEAKTDREGDDEEEDGEMRQSEDAKDRFGMHARFAANLPAQPATASRAVSRAARFYPHQSRSSALSGDCRCR